MFPAFHEAVVEKLGAVFSKTLTQVSESLQKLFCGLQEGCSQNMTPESIHSVRVIRVCREIVPFILTVLLR